MATAARARVARNPKTRKAGAPTPAPANLVTTNSDDIDNLTARRVQRLVQLCGITDLARKRISGEGLYLSGRALLVPMQDAEGTVWNVQRIYPDGMKLFLKGGRVEGLFWMVADSGTNCPTNPLCIGEGVGTMAAVRRATGHAVAATFSAANLEPVARALRQRWPDRPMVICADDDAHLIHHPRIRRNLGVDAASTTRSPR
jgi:phage/plasmid primase-like uncharacterized protein